MLACRDAAAKRKAARAKAMSTLFEANRLAIAEERALCGLTAAMRGEAAAERHGKELRTRAKRGVLAVRGGAANAAAEPSRERCTTKPHATPSAASRRRTAATRFWRRVPPWQLISRAHHARCTGRVSFALSEERPCGVLNYQRLMCLCGVSETTVAGRATDHDSLDSVEM